MDAPPLEIVPHCSDVQLDPVLAGRALWVVSRRYAKPAGEISVIVVDDALSRELHHRYFASDQPTDVMTFPAQDDSPTLAGEIYVNAQVAQRVAEQVGWTPGQELLLYLIHGLLHLAGLKDETEPDRQHMFQLQREVLIELGCDPRVVHRSVQLPGDESVQTGPLPGASAPGSNTGQRPE